MKAEILIFVAILLFAFSQLKAEQIDKSALFQYDKQKIEQTFTKVNQLEQTVHQQGQATLKEVKANHPELVQAAKVKESVSFYPGLLPEPPLGIPSVLWGICFGLVGILIVYLVTEDNEETKKALLGFLIAWGTVGLIALIVNLSGGCSNPLSGIGGMCPS